MTRAAVATEVQRRLLCTLAETTCQEGWIPVGHSPASDLLLAFLHESIRDIVGVKGLIGQNLQT